MLYSLPVTRMPHSPTRNTLSQFTETGSTLGILYVMSKVCNLDARKSSRIGSETISIVDNRNSESLLKVMLGSH
jgi:hypothetical protein